MSSIAPRGAISSNDFSLMSLGSYTLNASAMAEIVAQCSKQLIQVSFNKNKAHYGSDDANK
jgi:hypothetical protein